MQFIDLIKQQSFICDKLENRIRNVLDHGRYIKAKSNQHRNFVLNELKDRNIPAAVYYRIPLHLQKVFQNLRYQKGDFPVAKKTADNVFSIPMYPYLEQAQQDNIVEVVHAVA